MEKAVSSHKVLLCDIDVQGGTALKRKYGDSVAIFVIPPSQSELRKRLSGRKSESSSEMKRRLEVASRELSYWSYYDYLIVNDELKKATDKVDMIIAAERARTVRLHDHRFWNSAQLRLLGISGTQL